MESELAYPVQSDEGGPVDAHHNETVVDEGSPVGAHHNEIAVID
ncbi:hypothetical protein [Streptomyces sp. NPDC058661]